MIKRSASSLWRKFLSDGRWEVRQFLILIKWTVMGVITGTIVGSAGTIFAKCLAFVNGLRAQQPLLVLLLPVCGLLIVFLYRFFHNTNDQGTNMVISSIHQGGQVSAKMAPLIFVSTILTQLAGGSSGREGAAIQLGGSIADSLSSVRFFRFTDADRRLNIMCGMSAGFSALFGTPMAAAFFALEVITVGTMRYAALVPCTIASYTAYFLSTHWGIVPEAFPVEVIPELAPLGLAKFLLLGFAAGWLSMIFCKFMHLVEHQGKKYLANPYLRIAVGGCAILALRFVLGTDRYLGSGIGILEEIFVEGEPARWWDIAFKILFTALTLSVGFKGGEIVPSFCIGGCLGCVAAGLMGMPVQLTTACGMLGVFCGVTNCPVTSLLIGFEMFGFDGMPYYLITVCVSYALSGYTGLYHAQEILYGKTEAATVHRQMQ